MPIEIESPEQMGYENVQFNLTESSVSDATLKNLNLKLDDLILCYADHLGNPDLRKLISDEFPNLHPEDVLITAGAASALFIVATTLLSSNDHLVVIRPNYATNIEIPRAIGCEIDFVDLKFENGFNLDWDDLILKIKPNTRLLSLTHPHNPTGVCLPFETLNQLIEVANKFNLNVLLDETYRDLNFSDSYPLAASMSERFISVSSVSKAYGLPGIRVGWLVTRNKHLFEQFLAAKEQIFICNSVVDEAIALQFLLKKDFYFPTIKRHIAHNFETLTNWFNHEKRMEVVMPKGGVVCFPKIVGGESLDMEKFYANLNTKFKTYVGPGHWFEMPDYYMRIGFGWPKSDELSQGLINISKCLTDLGV
jgi:aspartate/methionine/tyrosine aminotransferase